MTAIALPRIRADATPWLWVAVLAATFAALAVVGVAYRLQVSSDGTAFADGVGRWHANGALVESLSVDDGPLRSGDRVLAVDGRSIEALSAGLLNPGSAAFPPGPGATVTYTVERAGERLDLAVPLTAYPVVGLWLGSWAVLLLVIVMAATGLYLVVRCPREPAAHAMFVLGLGMLGSTITWTLGLQVADFASGWGFWVYLVSAVVPYTVFFGALLHLALVFPRPLSALADRRWPIVVVYVAPFAAQLIPVFINAGLGGTPSSWLRAWAAGQAVMQPSALLVGVVLMALGYRAIDDPRRRLQVRAVAATMGFAAVAGAALWFIPEALTGRPLLPWNAAAVTGLPVPIALGLAIGRHQLFGLESVVRRSLVYGGLTVGVVTVYATSVVLLGLVLPGDGPYAVTLLATGAAALVALPLRDRLQRAVSRLLYGDRDEPYRAIVRLGQRLEASLEPATVLPLVAETVAQALRLPYAAVELRHDEGVIVPAAYGSPRGRVERLPLVHHGEEVGWLAVAPRSPDEPFGAADRALLADLARQAGAAAYAVRLTGDLQRSRRELVTAREEERRRLRRDLHDGVGPTLAGSLMKLEAARQAARTDPGGAERLLAELQAETREAIADVRRLAYDLRPPALDQLGLVGALEQEARRLGSNGCRYTVRMSEPLTTLPAAVEVAAYRIALEALTNVARHANAASASVELQPDDGALLVEVRDDGTGMKAEARAGVGLTSMRERAQELGGTLEVAASDGGGVSVRARLPLEVSTGGA
jgi:two-component system NarL family sensor kinase